VELAGAAITIGINRVPAEKPIPSPGDEGIQPVDHLAEAGKIVKVSDRAENRPGGDGADSGFEAFVNSAIGAYQMHGLHTSFMRNSGKTSQHAGLLKIERLHHSSSSQGDKIAGLSGTKPAGTVIEKNVSPRRIGSHRSGRPRSCNPWYFLKLGQTNHRVSHN
jgi:hypothetical protein